MEDYYIINTTRKKYHVIHDVEITNQQRIHGYHNYHKNIYPIQMAPDGLCPGIE